MEAALCCIFTFDTRRRAEIMLSIPYAAAGSFNKLPTRCTRRQVPNIWHQMLYTNGCDFDGMLVLRIKNTSIIYPV